MSDVAAADVAGPFSEWRHGQRTWSRNVARYVGRRARAAEGEPAPDLASQLRLAAPRTIGPVSHIFILARLQLLVAAILGAVLLDFAIEGSMREALRYAVVDARWQLPAMAIALLLACAALRFSCEAMIELVSPDLFDAPGNVGRLAHLLPRFLAIFVGFAAGVPLLKLADGLLQYGVGWAAGISKLTLFVQFAQSADALGGIDDQRTALIYGVIFIVTGLLVGIIGKGPHSHDREATAESSGLLRASLALLPIAAFIALAGTIWGIFPSDEPLHYLGIPHGALDRYLALDPNHILAQAALEASAIFLTAIVARFAFNVIIYLIAPYAMTAPGFPGAVAAWLPRIAAAAIGFVLTIRVISLYAATNLSQEQSYLLLGLALAYSMVALIAALIDGSFSIVTDSSTIFQRTGSRWLMGAERMAALATSWRLFFGLLLVGAVVAFLVFYDLSQVGRAQAIGPVAIILLWGFAATALFFPIAYMSHATRMPLLFIILIAAVVFAGFDINDNHQLRGAGTKVPSLQEALAASAQVQPTYYRETVDIGEWLKSRNDWNKYEHYPIFLIATEGGGIRAAYFTASVLAAFQDKCPAFAQHVIAISSVSGGSVGAAVFAGETADQAQNVSDVGCRLGAIQSGVVVDRARNVLATDLLSPLLGAALFPDALQRVLPLPIDRFDRARALEYALEDSWRRDCKARGGCDPERMSTKVEALYPREVVRRPVPHLFLNTTEAGTGINKPFATWDIGDLALPENKRSHRERNALPTPRLVPLQDRIAVDEVPLSAAAMVSARFPYLTPAARLGDVGHYVDGGYFENSGTWLIGGIAQNLIGQRLNYRNEADKELERAVRKSVIVAVVIRSSPCNPCGEKGQNVREQDLDASWNELLSPIRALLYTRDKRAEYSINDLGAMTSLIQRLTFRRRQADGQLTPAPAPDQTAPPATRAERAPMASECMNTICAVTVTFHNKSTAEVPLSWVLSSRARGAMDQAVDFILHENLQVAPAPPNDVDDANRLEGSYRRVMCLLQNDATSPGCAPASDERD